MIFNNIVNHLKLWCAKKSESYRDKNNNYGGVSSVVSMLLWELEFKLSSLIDKEFNGIDDFRKNVLDLIDIHYDHSIKNPQSNIAERIIEKVNDEFRYCLADVLFDVDNLPPIDLPYRRVVIDDEAKELIDKFQTVWGYESTSYWFPLMGDEPTHVADKFFVMFDYLEPHFKELCELIGLPQTHIYEYSEEDIWPDHCVETVEIDDCGGHETIYTDKDFSWAIYYSHEHTIAFAGAIVPKIKELLRSEKEHWDKFEIEWGSR